MRQTQINKLLLRGILSNNQRTNEIGHQQAQLYPHGAHRIRKSTLALWEP